MQFFSKNMRGIYHLLNKAVNAWLVILFVVFCFSSRAKGQVIRDPISYYTNEYGHDVGAKLLKLEVKFNRDGRKTIFLAYSNNADRSGNLWTGFIPVEGGYFKAPLENEKGESEQSGVTFRTDAYYVGHIPELKSRGLVAYVSGGGGKGVLVAYTLSGKALRQIVLAKINPEGKDQERYKKLFTDRPTAKIEELTIP